MNQKSVDRQKEIIQFIIDYSSKNGYPPTMREIGSYAGVSSSSTIHKILRKYHDDGIVMITDGIFRGIRVTDEGKELLGS
jgi:repressor LexA